MPAYDMNNIMNRIKNLRKFTIEVDIPDEFSLSGKMPYDATIRDGKGLFTIYAISKEEAQSKITDYIEKHQL
jgi:hypothetical protein